VRPVRALRLLEAVLDLDEVETGRVDGGRLVGKCWREQGEDEDERGEDGWERVVPHAVRDDDEEEMMGEDEGEEGGRNDEVNELEEVGAAGGLERVWMGRSSALSVWDVVERQ